LEDDILVNEYIKYITIPVNKVLLDHYQDFSLDEEALIILIKLLEYDRNHSVMSNLSDIIKFCKVDQNQLSRVLQLLIKEELLEINTDKIDGKFYESYNFEPLYEKLNNYVNIGDEKEDENDTGQMRELFDYIEQLYGRTISPNEYQRLNSWIDDSNYSVDSIKDAVDVAYKSNITSLQYVERILSSQSKAPETKGSGLPVISWLDRGNRLDDK
jgi:DNA replication protein